LYLVGIWKICAGQKFSLRKNDIAILGLRIDLIDGDGHRQVSSEAEQRGRGIVQEVFLLRGFGGRGLAIGRINNAKNYERGYYRSLHFEVNENFLATFQIKLLK